MRKFKDVAIESDGRDAGKIFRITEMDAEAGEWWAARALKGMIANGLEIPDEIAAGGMAALAAVGITALANIEDSALKSLLDEMFRCVQIVVGSAQAPIVRPLVKEDIEEISTRLELRKAWAELQLGFSFAAKPSTLALSAAQDSM